MKTDRLILRPLQESDVPAIVEGLGRFAVAQWTGRVPHPYHRSDALEYLAFAEGLDSKSCVRAITLQEAPESLIGIISYEFSAAADDAELGYWLAEAFWQRGFGREAAQAMVRHAFMETGQECLVASTHAGNIASQRILLGLGFEHTGSGTGFSKAQGREVALNRYVLGKQAWQNKKAAGN